MNQNTQIIQEIEDRLCKKAGLKRLIHHAGAAAYLNTGLKVAAIATPLQRSLSKEGFSFSELPVAKQLALWSVVFKTAAFHEVRNQALLYVERQMRSAEQVLLWKGIKTWVSAVDNWAHSDGLSSYYSKILEQHEDLVLPVLKKWNGSKNPWERRQSLVSLMYYQRTKKKFPPVQDMLMLIEALLEDEHYYVQKGVGWALRELRQVDERRGDRFLNEHLGRISAVAFTSATERIPQSEKEQIKLRRKQIRSGTV